MSEHSSSWEPELLESQLHGIDPENEPLDKSVEKVEAKRGPKKLPLMWSRVICLPQDSVIDVGAHEMEADKIQLQD